MYAIRQTILLLRSIISNPKHNEQSGTLAFWHVVKEVWYRLGIFFGTCILPLSRKEPEPRWPTPIISALGRGKEKN